MSFDLSQFATVGKWLFDTAKTVFYSFEFNFGDFTLNGWVLLIGVCIVLIVAWFLGKIFD